jgi:4-diphosphocytidyl-2-C-methyl-D-erythritol kinase
MSRLPAPAKINLALVVGPARLDGKHELVTVFQRIDLVDRITLTAGGTLEVTGFGGDTLVRESLARLAAKAGGEPRWLAHVDKSIPVAAGLGGGSSDAATAMRLANTTLARPLDGAALHNLAASLGADIPFFLSPGPQLGEGDGTELSPLELPQDYWVVVLLPERGAKRSTAAVYEAFDRRGGEEGFLERRGALLGALRSLGEARDLARLPRNDLATSPLAAELEQLGAFRADVTGAGPAVYGLFEGLAEARGAARRLRHAGRTWVVAPTWYG